MKLNTKKLDQVAYGRVVVATGSYLCRISGVIEPNKAKTGNNYKVEHTLLDRELVTSEGVQVLNPGNVNVTKWIGLQPSEKYDPDRLIKELAVAAGVYSDDSDVNTEDLEGKLVLVKLKHRKAEGANPESNDVAGWLPLSDEQRAQAEASPF